jgi:hypothetical protein
MLDDQGSVLTEPEAQKHTDPDPQHCFYRYQSALDGKSGSDAVQCTEYTAKILFALFWNCTHLTTSTARQRRAGTCEGGGRGAVQSARELPQ